MDQGLDLNILFIYSGSPRFTKRILVCVSQQITLCARPMSDIVVDYWGRVLPKLINNDERIIAHSTSFINKIVLS